MPKSIDITNQKFGRLTAIKTIGKNKAARILWQCRCDCGNETIVPTGDLRSGHTQSCGCYKVDQIAKALTKAPGVSARNQAYLQYKYRAKRSRIEFKMSLEKFIELSQKNCYYCDCKPSHVYQTIAKNGTYIYNGIDRVDNSFGYIEDNIVSCCKDCNFMKSDVSINIVEKVYEFIRRKTQ